ncbi:MAG: AraC family transcriptional regulator [Dorea sp.]|nr:AraC family transcriptional regulator [Dorea sp.]
MPIHFRNTPANEPFLFDSIGSHWNQTCVLRPKGYPLYHYLQTERGQGIVKIRGTEYILNEGEGLFTAPFIPHSYAKGSAEWATFFATFTGRIDSSIQSITGYRPVLFIDRERGAKIRQLVDEIMEKWEILSADTYTQSIYCYRMLMNFTDGACNQALTNDPLYLRYVEPVIREIESHYDTELTVQELSQMVYITPQYLSRLFRRFLGCSVYEYLTSCRINHARELLVMHTHLKVQEIARQSGYSDVSHFIAMFRKATGITPLEFRKIN